MKFEARRGLSVAIDTGVSGVELRVSDVTEVVAGVILDVNHARALAAGILAACDELHARSVGG